jgi:hypothetical protein
VGARDERVGDTVGARRTSVSFKVDPFKITFTKVYSWFMRARSNFRVFLFI